MASHESRICPRCGSEFECKPGSVLQCQCAEVELSNAQREYIADKYEDCLCKQCLIILRGEVEKLKS